MEDLMYVYVRCVRDTIILELENKAIDFIKFSHPDFEKKLLSYQNNILKLKKTFPLDYIMNLPKEFRVEKNVAK